MTADKDLVGRLNKGQISQWKTMLCTIFAGELDNIREVSTLCDMADAQLAARTEPIEFDAEAIAWALVKLRNFGVLNNTMDNALMADRLEFMLKWQPAAPPGRAEPQPVAEDELMALLRKHFDSATRRELTYTSWKDGIDIDRPTTSLQNFVADLRHALPACALGGEAKLQLTKQLRDISCAKESRIAHIYKVCREAAHALEACFAANDDLLRMRTKNYALGFQEAREAAARECERLGDYFYKTRVADMGTFQRAAAINCAGACRALEPKA